MRASSIRSTRPNIVQGERVSVTERDACFRTGAGASDPESRLTHAPAQRPPRNQAIAAVCIEPFSRSVALTRWPSRAAWSDRTICVGLLVLAGCAGAGELGRSAPARAAVSEAAVAPEATPAPTPTIVLEESPAVGGDVVRACADGGRGASPSCEGDVRRRRLHRPPLRVRDLRPGRRPDPTRARASRQPRRLTSVVPGGLMAIRYAPVLVRSKSRTRIV